MMESTEWWKCLLETEDDVDEDDVDEDDLLLDPLNITLSSSVDFFSEVFETSSVYDTREVSPVQILHPNDRKIVRTIRGNFVDEVMASTSKRTSKRTSITTKRRRARKRNKSSLAAGRRHPRKKPCTKTIEGCRCGRNHCLKLYCICLAAGKPCGPACRCTGCGNRGEQHDEAVRTKQKAGRIVDGAHTTGCRCTRSRCIKKYCECFHANAYCGPNCKCKQCENCASSKFLHRMYPRQRGKIGPRQLERVVKKKKLKNLSRPT